jgi:hydrogenase expression/formation protein HypE
MTVQFGVGRRRQPGNLNTTVITLSHGGGGKAMRDLIDEVFVGAFDNSLLNELEDQARLDLSSLIALGDRLAFTTDSYVVDPLFFPGGDIGKLAINGTVNDLAVGGATPLYLTCSMIIEEGFPLEDLRKIVASMKEASRACGVAVITGDTKVVGRGQADKLFINTAGIGVIPKGVQLSAGGAKAGDLVVLNGSIADHGAAIVGARQDLCLENSIESDCRPLNGLIDAMLKSGKSIHCLRDATRGGIATVLNEFAQASDVCIRINESAIPIADEVRGLCEILGFDPLYLANEGKLIAIVKREDGAEILECMRKHEGGRESAIIGEVTDSTKGIVVMKTTFGGERIVDMLFADQLPRIC